MACSRPALLNPASQFLGPSSSHTHAAFDSPSTPNTITSPTRHTVAEMVRCRAEHLKGQQKVFASISPVTVAVTAGAAVIAAISKVHAPM